MILHKIILLQLSVVASFSISFAQFSGSNQVSYQIGNQPSESPSNKTNLYNQLNFRYHSGSLSFGLRAEVYNTDSPFEYNRLSQKYVRLSGDGLRIQFGNFYESLGKLVLRSYEIPGTIFEDNGTRQRYGFYKDIEGLSVRYENDLIGTKMVFGRPLDFSLPPDVGRKMRRKSIVQGGEVNLLIWDGFTPGYIYLRSDKSSEVNEYSGLNIDGFLSDAFQYYLEYIQNSSPQYNVFALGRKSPHAFYGSLNYSFNWLNIIAEYKDYNEFTLVFNDPPQLVREHSYTLLNRATHAIEPFNETGYQLEFLINLDNFNTVTLNHSQATNKFGRSKFEFFEYYADINYYLKEDMIAKIFIDYSQDEIFSEKNRYAAGAGIESAISGMWSGNAEVQYQQFDKDFPEVAGNPSQDYQAKNFLFALSASYGPKFSVGGVVELSNDRESTNRLINKKEDIFISWPALNLSYQYDQNNSVSLFYGKRREGNACTGGICYQVLSFNGIELKINTRF